MLFNFAADFVTRMIIKAQLNGVITGLVKYLIARGVAVLQYYNTPTTLGLTVITLGSP
jgi:hypothetical protein